MQLSRRLTVFTLMRLRQSADDSRLILPINPDKARYANDSRLILPINPDKAPNTDDSRLILLINPDKAQKVSIIVYNALYTINSR